MSEQQHPQPWHVERPTPLKQRSGMAMCGLLMSEVQLAVSPEELRRRIHTKGRKATEEETCSACYDLARPKKPRPAKAKAPRAPREKKPAEGKKPDAHPSPRQKPWPND